MADVVLLSAGPGFGKTLAVASWLDRFPCASAWLTLDDSDNDLRTFWSDVLGALSGEVLPPDSPLRDIIPATAFGEPEVLRVRTALADLPGSAVLVLDDLHLLHDPAVLDSLSGLLQHRPRGLRLVLVSRADPALRLHRLRAAGGLTEIRFQDLAFTKDETSELFSIHDIALSDDHLRMLVDRTQGWPVGVRLAAMFLAGTGTEGIERFTGTERSVAEYLVGEVLDRLPPAERDFLLRTSITERTNASLAAALTGRDDSQRVLEGLVAANAFVVGLGDGLGEDDGWFGYHPLLRDLLSHRLILDRPGSGAELHGRAARWFAGRGQPVQAIRHALMAGDWQEVGRLLAASALPLVLTPEGPALAAAIEPLARRAVHDPNLATLLSAAIWHFHRHDFAAMRRDAAAAAEFLAESPDAVRVPAEILIAATTLTFHRTSASFRLAASSARLLDLLDRAPRRLVPAAPHYRVIGLNNLGVGQLWAGDLPAAETSLTAAESQAVEYRVGLAAVTARSHLALLDAMHGRLGHAESRIRVVRRLVERRGWTAEPQTLAMYVALALTLFARHRLDEAADVVSAGLAASSRGSDTGSRLALGVCAVGVAVARRDADAARAAADRLASELAAVPDPPDLLKRWCEVALAQVPVVFGDPAEAVRRLDPSGDLGFTAALERVTIGRANLALGNPSRLPSLLAPLTGPTFPYLGPAVEARILLALAANREHRDGAALDLLTEAIDLAEPEGLISPFLDGGPVLLGMITRHRHVVAKHLDFTGGILTDPMASVPPTEPGPAAMVDRLTERELVVLRYLPTMLKASEIGRDLYLSVNTVKSHMQSIYRKLGVSTRRGAVERARELNLL